MPLREPRYAIGSNYRLRGRSSALRPVRGLGWIRTAKWAVVALLAVWLLCFFIAWLRGALT
jgi:hypothetical protein